VTAPALPPAENIAAPEMPALAELSILIAEDDPLAGRIIEMMLADEGARLICVESGDAALSRIGGSERFDILLTDIKMEGRDGFSTAEEAGRLAPGLPVIGITGSGGSDIRERCREAGMVDCLIKPFDREELIGMILEGVRRDRPTRKPHALSMNDDQRVNWKQAAESEPGAQARSALEPTDFRLIREISHDLNNAITAVLGYTDLAQSRYAPDGEGKLADYLHQVALAGRHARSLVRGLRTILPPRARSAPYSAGALAREVAAELCAIAASGQATIDVQAGDARLQANRSELRGVLLALGREAIGAGGQLLLRIDAAPEVREECPYCHHEMTEKFVVLSIEVAGAPATFGTEIVKQGVSAEAAEFSLRWGGRFDCLATGEEKTLLQLLLPRAGG